MANRVIQRFFLSVALPGLLALFVAGCSGKSEDAGKVIFTQAPSASVDAASVQNGTYKYADGLQIVMGQTVEEPQSMEVLTKDFASARAPELSYDGKMMVFSAKKTQADTWQIWTLNLDDRSITQVTAFPENCTDPTWLADGRIAFSRLISDELKVPYHALFTIDAGGCCEQRITYQPHDDLNAMVLNDGRILFSSQQIYPEMGHLKFIAMRPDGTKAELFYAPDSTVAGLAKACETRSGFIAFAESGLFRTVSFKRPLHSLEKRQISNVDFVQSSYSMGNGSIISSVRKVGAGNYSLTIFASDDKFDSEKEIQDAANHLIEPVIVESRTVPKKLPSLMNMDDPSGYIVCLNVDASTIHADEALGNASKIQVLDYSGLVGETEISSDGSFYVALPADQPLRFQTVNSEGKVVRGPSSWIWMRPSERRGCVGCHEDSEIVPENVVPKAIEKAPVAMIK